MEKSLNEENSSNKNAKNIEFSIAHKILHKLQKFCQDIKISKLNKLISIFLFFWKSKQDHDNGSKIPSRLSKNVLKSLSLLLIQ